MEVAIRLQHVQFAAAVHTVGIPGERRHSVIRAASESDFVDYIARPRRRIHDLHVRLSVYFHSCPLVECLTIHFSEQGYALSLSSIVRFMKPIALIAALVAAGCSTSATHPKTDSRMVYPNATYRYSESRVMITPELRSKYGLASADPFLTQKVTAVEYWYYDAMGDVEAYYESLLPSLGWHKVHGFDPLEKTLCGGDWVGVFQKDGVMFKIHACGAQRLQPEIIAQGTGLFLTYYFLPGTRPESILGEDYRRTNLTMRSSEPPSAGAVGGRSP